MLDRNDLRQLAQRITGRYHLEPLSREETASYLRHRLRIAGATQEIFTRGALDELYRTSGGVPRLVNVIGDRALLGGYTEDRHVVNGALVRRAAGEVFGRRVLPAWLPWTLGGATTAALVAASWLAWSMQHSSAPAAPAIPPPVAAPVATPPAPPPINLLTVLHASTEATDLDGAYTRLFALWNARYVASQEDACPLASRQQLECLNEAGGIEALRRYNRPALLSLVDDAGNVHHVVAIAMAADTARLRIGDADYDVPLMQLQARWSGEFVMLWRPPQPHVPSLSPGMHGEAVANLRQRLQQVTSASPETAGSEDFDEPLRQLVLQFQRANGLIADGVAGARTQALLDSKLPAPDTPLLSAVIK
jgi:general secretion pathway protein A